jgi:hypothetical protein
MMAATGGAIAGVSSTQALSTSTAQAQVNTITAGTWAPVGPVPAACSGKFDFSIKTSSVDFEAELRSNTIVYIDSAGHFDFKNYTHLCLVISVWGFTVVNLDVSVYLDFSLLSGWLCFLIHTLPTCGSVGGGGGSGGSTHHRLGLMALATPATQGGDSFAEQLQDKITSGQVTGFTVEATPSSSETSAAPTAPTKSADRPSDSAAPKVTPGAATTTGGPQGDDRSTVATGGKQPTASSGASGPEQPAMPSTTPSPSPTGEASASETAAAEPTPTGAQS